MPPRKRQRTGGGKTLPKLMRERFVRWYLKLRADGDLTSKTACVERAAEAYGIANSTAWDLVGKHEAGGLEALTPAKAGGANNQIIDTSVLQCLACYWEMQPDAQLKEYRWQLAADTGLIVSESAICDALNKTLKLTRKKITMEVWRKYLPQNQIKFVEVRIGRGGKVGVGACVGGLEVPWRW